MFRGYEIRLMLSMTNQASSAIRRAGSDLRALNAESTLGLQQARQNIALTRAQNTAQSIGIQMERVGMRQDRLREEIRQRETGSRKLRQDMKDLRIREARQMGLTKSEEQMARAISGVKRGEYAVAQAKAAQATLAAKIDSIEGDIPDHLIMQDIAREKQLIAAESQLTAAKKHLDTTGKQLQLDSKSVARAEALALKEQELLQSRWENYRAIKAARTELGLTDKQLNLLAQRLGVAHMEADRMNDEITRTGKLIQQLPGQRIETAGRTLSHVGRVAGIAGLVGTAATGAAAEQTAQFDKLTTQAGTQARDIMGPLSQVGERSDEIRNKILDLMKTFPASQEEMANSAYDIFSSINLVNQGVTDMAGGFALMRTANKIAVAGNEDLATSTSALVTITNNFVKRNKDGTLSIKDLNANMDTTFDIIRFGRMRLGDFNQMMNKVAPAASGAGQSLQDVGGAMAFLTEIMPSQQRASTGLARLLDAFQHPDFLRGMKELDATIVDSTGHLLPFDEVMKTIVNRFPELEKGGTAAQNFFRTVTQAGRLARSGRPGQGIIFTQEGRRALTQIVGHMDEYLERQKQIEDNTGEFNAEFSQMIQSQGVQWEIFKNQIRALVLILGQAAIPVFAAIGEKVAQFVGWFRNLSPGMQKAIGLFAAITPLVLLFGGALLSVVGSLVAMMGWLKIMNPEISLLTVNLGILAGIGAIAIILKTLWTGEASAKDFLIGALAGAATGAAIGGPLGALVGGITVPVVMEISTHFKGKPAQAGVKEAFKQYWDNFQGDMKNRMNFDEFKKAWEEQVHGMFGGQGMLPANLLVDQSKAAWSANARAALRAGKITQKQYLAGMRLVGFSDTAVTEQQQRFVRKRMKEQAGLTDKMFMRGMIPAEEKHLTLMQKIKEEWRTAKTTTERNELQKLMDQLDAINRSFHKGNDELSRWKQNLKRTTIEARKEAENQLTQAANNLTSIYQGFQQQNQSQFGQLFQGPWLDSEFGQTAKEWGITPGIKDLTKDLKMQLDNFTKFRNDLAALKGRGAPQGLIDELQQLGPEALDQLEALRKAAPAQFQQFVNVWNQKKKAIDDATKIDFDAKLKQWFAYGKGIAQNIILGLQSENVQLDAAFKKYITNKFPNLVNELTQKAVDEFKKENPAPKAAPKANLSPGGNKPTVVHSTKTEYHYHAAPGEDQATSAKKAAFIWKNGGRSSAGGRTGQ